MNESRQIILIGGGAFAVEIASYIHEINRDNISPRFIVTDIVSEQAGRLNDIETTLGYGINIASTLDGVNSPPGKYALIAIGDPMVRRRISMELADANVSAATLIHPRAHVSASASIGPGCIIAPLAFVGPHARLESHVCVNVSAIIGHDVVVGAASAISPGAMMNGHAACGEAVFLGSGAVIYPKVELGAFSKLSAGSILTRSIGEGHVAHGNPASGRQMIRIPE